MEIRYQIVEDKNLIIQKLSGVFSLQQYIVYSRQIGNHISKALVSKVLNDFRELSFGRNGEVFPKDFNEQIDKIISIRRSINEHELENRRATVVFLVINPLPTVIAQLFVNNFPNLDYHFCSTLSKAKDILELEIETDKLEDLVEKPENLV